MDHHLRASPKPFQRPPRGTFGERMTPNERVERFERIMRRLQPERHMFAVEAHWLENYVSKMDESAYQIGNMPSMVDYSGLPEKAQQRMHAVLEWYRVTADARKQQEQKLQEHFGTTDSRQLGDAVFAHVQGEKLDAAATKAQTYSGHKKPIGSVYFLSHPLAFGMLFTNAEDYRAFTGSHTSIGIYSSHSQLSGESDWTAGEYEAVPMIALMRITDEPIKTRDIRRIAKIDTTVPHELAHAFHHQALGLFGSVESDWEAYLSPEDAAVQAILRRIKDEVLAFVKDGSRTIDLYLANQSYKYFFDLLDDNDRQRTVRCIAEINALVELLDAKLAALPILQRRQLFYYQLLDVPLPLMPAVLREMDDYYHDVVSASATAYPLPDMSQLPEAAYFGPLQPKYHEVSSAMERYQFQQGLLDDPKRNLLYTKPARASAMRRDQRTIQNGKFDLYHGTKQPFPAYATELKFLPETGRSPAVEASLDRFIGEAQSVGLRTIWEQSYRLRYGQDVVGEKPIVSGLVDTLTHAAGECGFILDQCELTQVDVDSGKFVVAVRLVVPALQGQQPCRIKMQLNFTEKYSF